MRRLIVAELRTDWAIWIGVFITVTAVATIIGLCAAVITAVGAVGGPALVEDTSGLLGTIISLNAVAGLVAVSSVSTLTVSLQRRKFALWQLIGFTPVQTRIVLLGQLALVGLAAGVTGALLAMPLTASATTLLAEVIPGLTSSIARPGVDLVLVFWIALSVAALTVIGAQRGVVHGTRVSPMNVLRAPRAERRGLATGRWIVASLCLLSTVLLVVIAAAGDLITGASAVLFIGLFITATVAALAPAVIPLVLRSWTAAIQARVSSTWFLARANAAHQAAISVSTVSPIFTAAALVSGLFTSVQLVTTALSLETGVVQTADNPISASVLLLGGPVVLSAIAAAMTVLMSGRSRRRDLALMNVAGATPRAIVGAAALEAVIYVGTAALCAVTVVAVQSLVSIAVLSVRVPGVPFFVDVGSLGVVTGTGLVLVGLAIVVPTMRETRRSAVRQLAAE